MEFTISELARVVGKSETYVRQHIHRKHLIPRRQGRSVFVGLDEAARWARERGLPFDTPTWISAPPADMRKRAARMTVLVRHGPDERPRNLFTLVRHRRQDALGPWMSDASECWSSEDLGDCLRLLSLDASLERCQSLVKQILASGTLGTDDVEVDYSLHPNARRHWAYRDDRPTTDASVRSPFRRHSAEIVEYWSFDSELREQWLEALAKSSSGSRTRLKSLGFPLDRRVDRVGNLMIARAEDAITCELMARHDQTLRMNVEGDDLLPFAYRASVWGSHSGDEVIRREVEVNPGQTVINLASDVDHVGFSVCRTIDGQCVDLMETTLIMEANFRLAVGSRPTIQIQGRLPHMSHKFTPASSKSIISVRADDSSAEIDKGIRRLWLERRLAESEAVNRKGHDFVRFQPEEFKQAVQHVTNLIHRDSYRPGLLYWVDPYFEPYLNDTAAAKSELVQAYLELFAATTGRLLRILCGQQRSDCQPWWVKYPKDITKHVSVRTFRQRDERRPGQLKPGFHDRYLITPERETVMTNSLNGWRDNGVTFISLPFDVYRAEAEQLWSMELESVAERLLVEEIA